jgi:hypothetical protein
MLSGPRDRGKKGKKMKEKFILRASDLSLF